MCELDTMDRFLFEKKLCGRMRLWEFDNQYILEPLEGGNLTHLAISRKTGELQLISKNTHIFHVLLAEQDCRQLFCLRFPFSNLFCNI